LHDLMVMKRDRPVVVGLLIFAVMREVFEYVLNRADFPVHRRRGTDKFKAENKTPNERNRSPSHSLALTIVLPTTATISVRLRYASHATDPGSDPLSYDLTVKPDGMVVEPRGSGGMVDD
jgi:hypothetical protein